MMDTCRNITRIEKENIEKITFSSEHIVYKTYNSKDLNSKYNGLINVLETMLVGKVSKIEFESHRNFLIELITGEVYYFEFRGETLSYYVYDFEKIIEKVGK